MMRINVGRACRGIVTALTLLLIGCNSDSKKSGELPYGQLIQHSTTRPTAPPDTIYVGHFDLGQTILKQDPGLVNRIASARPRLLRANEKEPADPQERIAFLGELLATTLVKDLKEKGYNAQRIGPSDARATSGWEVSGALLRVDEGSRMQRTIIGFGAGESQVELTVAVTNLQYGNDQPFVDLNLKSDSGKKPGAFVTVSPFAAAAKYHMNSDAGSKDVETAAKEIAADLEHVIKDIQEKK